MKRALVTFGNPFGLALYDKSQRQVTGSTASGQGAAAGTRSGSDGPANTLMRRAVAAPTPTRTASQAQARPAAVIRSQGPAAAKGNAPAATSPTPETSLDQATIQALQERIRGLLPPQLNAFSQAFRAAFQVPDAIPSIAGLITEPRHRLWIEQFLSQGQAGTT